MNSLSRGRVEQVVRDAAGAELYEASSLNQYTNRVRITNGGATNEFVYDLNGNMLSDGTLNYAWDEENRLVMVSNSTWHTEFAYDGLSRRIETREYTNGALTSVKRHMYDGWLPVAELNETNGLVSAMTWGLDLSLTFEGAGGIGGLLSLTQHSTPDTLFYFYDGNGNVVDVLDDADTLAAHYEYDPFGNRLVAEGDHADQPFQWSSKMRHESSGLVYYGYRFLKPDIGRWLNRDPIEEKGGVNVYVSSGNSPIMRVDYLGLWLWSFTVWDQGGPLREPILHGGRRLYGETHLDLWSAQGIVSACRERCGCKLDAHGSARVSYWWTDTGYRDRGGNTARQHERIHVSIYQQEWENLKIAVSAYAPSDCMCCDKASCYEDLIALFSNYHHRRASQRNYAFHCRIGQVLDNDCRRADEDEEMLRRQWTRIQETARQCARMR